ncbi:MAG: ATP-binding protein [Bdellovibrio sp.]|nr:ATP-binding protein [Bdellovibrio sp.]
MPHQRLRYVEPHIRKALTYSAIVGVIGHRQVGKTTLVSKIGNEYITFDNEIQLRKAFLDPINYLLGHKSPFTIDECQLCHAIFPSLKDHVRINKKPGQFLLTGSVRFSSRKAIKESLTGRIANVEVYPLTISEIYRRPLPDLVLKILQGSLEKILAQHCPHATMTKTNLLYYLDTGGLPGICFFRSPEIRLKKWADHLETVLDRDLRLIVETSIPYPTLKNLVIVLAEAQGEPFEYASLSRKTRISALTLKRLLFALEGIFLIRTLPASGGLNTPTFYFEDQGFVSFLLSRIGFVQQMDQKTIVRLIHSCVLPQFRYRPESIPQFFQFKTRGGAFVPFGIKTRYGTLGLIANPDSDPLPSSIASAKSFLRHHSQSKVLIICSDGKPRILSPQIASMPVWWVI